VQVPYGLGVNEPDSAIPLIPLTQDPFRMVPSRSGFEPAGLGAVAVPLRSLPIRPERLLADQVPLRAVPVQSAPFRTPRIA